MFIFTPTWNDPIWLAHFVQKGWFNHQEEVTSWFVIQVIEIQVIRKKPAGETKKSLQLLFKLCWVGSVPSIFWQKKVPLPGNSAGALFETRMVICDPELKGWNRDLQPLGIKLGHGSWIFFSSPRMQSWNSMKVQIGIVIVGGYTIPRGVVSQRFCQGVILDETSFGSSDPRRTSRTTTFLWIKGQGEANNRLVGWLVGWLVC